MVGLASGASTTSIRPHALMRPRICNPTNHVTNHAPASTEYSSTRPITSPYQQNIPPAPPAHTVGSRAAESSLQTGTRLHRGGVAIPVAPLPMLQRLHQRLEVLPPRVSHVVRRAAQLRQLEVLLRRSGGGQEGVRRGSGDGEAPTWVADGTADDEVPTFAVPSAAIRRGGQEGI
eukprot:1185732-Prorocentrum_minimum.AAC.2